MIVAGKRGGNRVVLSVLEPSSGVPPVLFLLKVKIRTKKIQGVSLHHQHTLIIGFTEQAKMGWLKMALNNTNRV